VLAFRVRLNGKRIATAGIHGPHVLTAMITSVARGPEARRLWPRDVRFRAKELTLQLGGMSSHGDGASEHADWAHLGLKSGDTVSVTIVDTARVDEPARRRTTERATIETAERRQLERLQRKYRQRARPKAPGTAGRAGATRPPRRGRSG